MPITSPRICPILVEREADLAILDDLLTAAATATGRLALLSGEAGAGKSRLAREVAARATARDFHLLSGSCTERDRDFPFAPFVDALRQQRLALLGSSSSLTSAVPELLAYLHPGNVFIDDVSVKKLDE